MNTFLKTTLACFVAIIVHSIFSFFVWMFLLTVIMASVSQEEAFSVRSCSVLKVDVGMPLPDSPSSKPLDNFDYSTFKFKQTVSLYDAVALINAAAEDTRIDGIYLNIPAAIPSSMSAMYELRQAIDKFRDQSGKFVIAYGDVYSQGGYYLATGADKVYMNPMGGMDWSGMSSSVIFYKGLFEKLGIEPEIIRHGKFKGAVEPFLLDKMSDENRLQMEELLGSIWGYMVGEISQSRSIVVDSLQKFASEMTILDPKIALDKKMVDELYYTDQVYAELAKLTGVDEPRFVTLSQYKTAGGVAKKNRSKNQIALVYAQGDIVDGGYTETSIVGNVLAAQLRELRENDKVKAVVLRVNSPGGSVLASDVIWREVSLIKEVKPMIVSMGEYAASGGYYISCPADAIVTTPTTLTGSIGVFGMMFNVEKGAKEKLGLTVDVVKTNPMADMGSIFRGLTAVERQMIQNSIDSTYTHFVNLVCQGRDLDFDEVDEMAQGRVWSGLQAVDNSLADKIGTLTDAIELAVEKAGIGGDYRVRQYPYKEESFSALFSSMSEISSKFLKSSMGIAPQVEQIEDEIMKHQGVWAKMPYYKIEIK